MAWCERKRIGYIFGLAGNPVLLRRVGDLAEDAALRRVDGDAEKVRRYDELRYAATSWKTERRVIARVEAGPQGAGYRDLSCARGSFWRSGANGPGVHGGGSATRAAPDRGGRSRPAARRTTSRNARSMVAALTVSSLTCARRRSWCRSIASTRMGTSGAALPQTRSDASQATIRLQYHCQSPPAASAASA
jgi:Transposase DDE domain group 1